MKNTNLQVAPVVEQRVEIARVDEREQLIDDFADSERFRAITLSVDIELHHRRREASPKQVLFHQFVDVGHRVHFSIRMIAQLALLLFWLVANCATPTLSPEEIKRYGARAYRTLCILCVCVCVQSRTATVLRFKFASSCVFARRVCVFVFE